MISILICFLALCLKKLGFLTWLFLHYKGDLGPRIYNFTELFMTGSWKVCTFFELLYSNMPSGEGDDNLIWQFTRIGIFDVCSYHNFLFGPCTDSFPWKSIWYVKAPKRVSFFSWIIARGRILTIDNLVKSGMPLVNWCCLCCCDGKFWTTFCSTVSLLVLCGVKFLCCLGSSG